MLLRALAQLLTYDGVVTSMCVDHFYPSYLMTCISLFAQGNRPITGPLEERCSHVTPVCRSLQALYDLIHQIVIYFLISFI